MFPNCCLTPVAAADRNVPPSQSILVTVGHEKAAVGRRKVCGIKQLIQEAAIPIENYSPIIIGLIAVVALWFAFTVVRKLFGLALLAAVAIGAWMLWNDSEMLYSAADTVLDVVDW